jgi:tetratricopeptide (TPR) repeat protein
MCCLRRLYLRLPIAAPLKLFTNVFSLRRYPMNHKGIVLLIAVLLSSGCSSLRIGGQVQSGRQALLAGNMERALPYFQEVANNNPDYIYESVLFRESIWTYLGRSQYALGMLEPARASFERALSVYQDDYLAKIYLGLTLARTGDRSTALKEIQAGMQGLHDWLEYMERSRPFSAYWDPLREIRSELEKNLAMIKGKDIAWDQLIASGEWIGKRMEEEIENVRRDERRQFERHDRDGRGSGVSLGIGVGF